ncbi:MAG: coproporphyrinogen III oxidase [Fusobacterium periodonticum]|nr:coproporphyrinogen III oxidase [Fusobacterium periodonticum]
MLVYSFKILDGEEIFIKSGIIIYMFDTMKWINTFNKLKIKNKGLFYHGTTYFEKDNIKKLKEIIFCWRDLFSEATENFEIEVLLDQNKEEYYIENHNKKEVIESLEKLIDLCNSAEKENKEIKCTKRTIKLGNIK